jgi:hypothetical protein
MLKTATGESELGIATLGAPRSSASGEGPASENLRRSV